MLIHLHIQNYALIDNLDIDFKSGFSVITGETGAGKSIILGALAILLGQRADSNVISNGAKRCVIEGNFVIESTEVVRFFEKNDLDFDNDECIIRRELSDTGKSRAFINDTPVSLAQVKELSSFLVDIHSQHQNLLLGNADFQLNVLDSVAEADYILHEYHDIFTVYMEAQRELVQFEQEVEKNRENLDFLKFQHDEIAAAALVDGEQEELEEELLVLENAETIKQTVYEVQNILDALDEKLNLASHSLNKVADVFPAAAQMSERLDSCAIELDDIHRSLGARDISFDPARLEYVNERLNTLLSLQKKYHKANVGELIQMQQELRRKLDEIENHDDFVLKSRQVVAQIREAASKKADELTAMRKAAAAKVEDELSKRLQPMGMPDIVFSVKLEPLENLAASGQDSVHFLFSANKNATPRDLDKIASGGEIARVMLALKALLANHRQLPTIIFDEIDTGVSGRIADEMGVVMEGISQQTAGNAHTQVICITHNPQIAARGSWHYRVFKKDGVGATHTHIELLSSDQRVQEIAQMLSTAAVSEAAISNAKTLLHL